MKQNWKHLRFYVADLEKSYMAKGSLVFVFFCPLFGKQKKNWN